MTGLRICLPLPGLSCSFLRSDLIGIWKKNTSVSFEPQREKNRLRGFRPGLTQTGLYSHRKELESSNFGYKKRRHCTILVAKIKAMISFAVSAKLICAFVFAPAKIRFSRDAAHFRYFIEMPKTLLYLLGSMKEFGYNTEQCWTIYSHT